jgi:hypothetical protein
MMVHSLSASFRPPRRSCARGLFEFSGAQRLAVGAIATHFGPRQHDLETEVCLDLAA